jgi:hypothetical protein
MTLKLLSSSEKHCNEQHQCAVRLETLQESKKASDLERFKKERSTVDNTIDNS